VSADVTASLPRVAPDAAGLARAAAVLRAGGIVALPTETLYGLAVATDRPDALARLSDLKERPLDAPFPVVVAGHDGPAGAASLLAGMAPALQARFDDLCARFWPGPLTLVLPARPGLSPELVGPRGEVGLRWSPDPAVQALLEAVGAPLTATSANLRGEPAPSRPAAVVARLSGRIDLLIDGGDLPPSLPSTVLRLGAAGEPSLLRPGRLPLPLLLDPEGLSLDALRRGRVRFVQPRSGLRVNIDPVLLALFLRGRLGSSRVADLGSGVGILPLLLASDGASGPFWAVELQASLAALARENARLNGLGEDRLRVEAADLRDWGPPSGPLDWVVSNPPFLPVGKGRVSPDPLRAHAVHELSCSFADLLRAAARTLRPGGRLAFIHAGDREAELSAALGASGFALERRRRVVSGRGEGPRRVLFQARLGAGPAQPEHEPDLCLHDSAGGYCPEVAAWLEGD